MAFWRRAHWVPCQALVLTALTIQMISWVSAVSDISFVGKKDERESQVTQLMEKHQLSFDCGRLMMCVFTGYLLPAMVRASWTNAWSDIGGLILTVLSRLAFELYFVWRIRTRHQSAWFVVSNTTLFIASLVLSLLLSCAVLAGKSIRSLLSGKVHWVLSCCYCPLAPSTPTSSPDCNPRNAPSTSNSRRECNSPCCSNTGGPCKNWCCTCNLERCENTEDHVLKCWIVARVSQPEYIMARSVFSSLAGVIVTMAVVILVVKWGCLRPPLVRGIGHQITFLIQFAFIVLGWIVVSFRWLTAVLYFPRKYEFLRYLEDFWTQSIVDLKAELDAQLTCKLYKEKIVKQRRPEQRVIVDIITKVRLHHILLPMRVWLQIVMVCLSKACWGPSQMLVGIIRPFITSTQHRWLYGRARREEGTEFHKFKKALDYLRMPGEKASDLWTANEAAFERARGKMEQGFRKGEEDCAELIKLIKQQSPASLNRKKNEDDYFNKMSWKRKGVSLMYSMVHVYEDTSNFDAINGATRDNIINSDIQKYVVSAYKIASVINDAMEACSDAWDLFDFVDSTDNGRADNGRANIEFDNVRNMWQKHFSNLRNLKRAVEALPSQHTSEEWQSALENWRGSKDWVRLTLDCNRYNKLYMKSEKDQLSKTSQEQVDEKSQKEQVAELQSKLAYVIHACFVHELGKALIEKCNKWAEEGNDEEIYHATFITGKAKALRDQVNKNDSVKNPVALTIVVGEIRSPSHAR